MIPRLKYLFLGSLVFWAAICYPAYRLGGESAAVYSTIASLLCLAPTAAIFLWADWAFQQSSEQQIWMLLGGAGVRMAFVLGVGLALYALVPFFGQTSFWIWLLVFYLFTLALEIVLLVEKTKEK